MSHGDSKKTIVVALVGNLIISVAKFIAASISGSSAMLSEGIHSLVDSGNQGLFLYGIKASKKPASPHFPFGHGKEVYFWSFVVAILIFALGAGISIYEGVHKMMHPSPVGDPTLSYIILVISILIEGGACYVALKHFNHTRGDLGVVEAIKKGKDPVNFLILFEDD